MITLTNISGTITVKASNGATLMTLSAGANWNDALASAVLTDSDNSQWQWDAPSQTFVPALSLGDAQAAQVAAINAAFNAQLAAGVTVTGGGITATLPADIDSQNTFARFVVTLITAAVPDTQAETIFDINGAPISDTAANIKALLGAYGLAIKAAIVARLTKIAQVQAATTVAAVQAITYP